MKIIRNTDWDYKGQRHTTYITPTTNKEIFSPNIDEATRHQTIKEAEDHIAKLKALGIGGLWHIVDAENPGEPPLRSPKTFEFDVSNVHFTVETDGHGGGSISSTGNVFVADEDLYDEYDEPMDPMIRERDAIESLVLAHACAGVDIESEAYQAGLRTAIEQIGTNA